mmetsp:Transcript_54494/g.162842  ORF Transcript_54494/g.162842 Transcript_54494/m.162842 type:complete len:87 (-) Transcript_54494:294-554(-)
MSFQARDGLCISTMVSGTVQVRRITLVKKSITPCPAQAEFESSCPATSADMCDADAANAKRRGEASCFGFFSVEYFFKFFEFQKPL